MNAHLVTVSKEIIIGCEEATSGMRHNKQSAAFNADTAPKGDDG